MKISVVLPIPNPDICEVLHESICALSSACDGAYNRDGKGFNRDDLDWGLSDFADTDPKQWSMEDAQEIWFRLRKYQRQLERDHGIDLSDLPRP